MKKKLMSFLMVVVLIITALSLPTAAPNAQAATFEDLNQSQIVTAMGAGWNLGNQLDAYAGDTVATQTPSETAWGNPVITQSLIDAVANAGFKTIRIPVTWGNKIGAAPTYTIDPTYLNRVKEVVDYAINDNLYVIINIHHDIWINQPGAQDQAPINDELGKVWAQISTAFESYDEHLIFESMNEIGGDVSSTNEAQYAASINAYNQTFVTAVRSTGGNNAKRWLSIPGIYTIIDYTLKPSFVIPNDSLCTATGKRIMIAVHFYQPWEFGLRSDDIVTQWGSTAPDPAKTSGWGNEDYMTSLMVSLYNRFMSQGYPVVVGEYGSIDKSQVDPANLQCRELYAKTMCELAKQYGAVPVYWDNNYNEKYGFGLFDRATRTITQPTLINTIVNVFSTTATPTPTPTTLDGIYYIKNVNSNLNLDVNGASTANKASLIQYTYNGASNQKFKLVSAGNGYYYIYTGVTGYSKVLDITQKKTADGTPIIQYQYNGGTNQQFEVKQISPGVYSILTRLTSSNSALTVTDASTANYATIEQRSYTGASNQQWILTTTN